MHDFIPGIDLARVFYEDHVRTIAADVPHTAALLGEGSEVLGFDTERSTDHAWGPRLQLFVEADSVAGIKRRLEEELPDEVRGWPARFYRWQENEVAHHVEVWTLEDWLSKTLGYDPRDGMPNARWLATSQQSLLHVTAGALFHDGTGELTAVREQLSWYSRDVWLWIMASAWQRVQDIEPMVGRTAETGDEIGNLLVIAKLIGHLMSLCFLQEQRYAPYLKWRARAFMELEGAKELAPKFGRALSADGLDARIEAVAESLEEVGRRHNDLRLTEYLDYRTGPFDVKINDAVRPFRVLNANRYVKACFEAIKDDGLKDLDAVGSLDQLLDTNDLVTNFTDWPRKLEAIFSGKLRNT